VDFAKTQDQKRVQRQRGHNNQGSRAMNQVLSLSPESHASALGGYGPSSRQRSPHPTHSHLPQHGRGGMSEQTSWNGIGKASSLNLGHSLAPDAFGQESQREREVNAYGMAPDMGLSSTLFGLPEDRQGMQGGAQGRGHQHNHSQQKQGGYNTAGRSRFSAVASDMGINDFCPTGEVYAPLQAPTAVPDISSLLNHPQLGTDHPARRMLVNSAHRLLAAACMGPKEMQTLLTRIPSQFWWAVRDYPTSTPEMDRERERERERAPRMETYLSHLDHRAQAGSPRPDSDVPTSPLSDPLGLGGMGMGHPLEGLAGIEGLEGLGLGGMGLGPVPVVRDPRGQGQHKSGAASPDGCVVQVDNIPREFSAADLQNLCGSFGRVVSVTIQASERGYQGIVGYAESSQADMAIIALDGMVVAQHTLSLSVKR
ncbi:hypothetical protein KIPB_007676, partial [Kipferlia bialata]